jgi:glutathione peroxidase
MSIFDYSVENRKGNLVSMADFKGKVLLVVNTATGCGFTPQYQGLEDLWQKYNSKGLEILDFPCDQFGHQAPGSDDDIHEFCQMKYKTSFDNFKKIEVNGENASELFKFLKSQKGFTGFTGEKAGFMEDFISKAHPDFRETPDIKWNFTKFLIDRNGNVIQRYESTVEPQVIAADIEKLL